MGLLKKIIKIVLLFALLALVVLMTFGLALFLKWPWWTAVFILFGIAGTALAVFFARRIILRRREQQFVQQVIAQDQACLEQVSQSEKDRYRDLQQRWKEAIKTLKKSHLRKLGNPLYVLPWYMIIGESGSGKTTAIKSAGLSSPFADIVHVPGLSGTKNCDWWFFEQAVILDTAGRYAIPIEPGKDKDEWQKFLHLLAKYRKKEPINGLIVTVAADKLLTGTAKALEHDGLEIRNRINELMRALGFKFPVYVLVTKCDLIVGMTEFCDALPAQALDQAMGFRSDEQGVNAIELADKAVDETVERLREIRLLLLGQERGKSQKSEFFLFPEEFSNLKSGLLAFVKGAFAETPYQETPMLKGIYFSSARQEGSPYSHLLHSLGLVKKAEVLPGTDRGLFLHDFFASILPKDRGTLAPTVKSLQWQSVTRNLGLAAWIAMGIAICGLLSFSFVKNLWSLRQVSKEFAQPPAITGKMLSDLMTLEKFRTALKRVESANSGWWIPRFGLNESVEVEEALKEKYCNWFYDLFLKPTDKKVSVILSSFSDKTPPQELAAYIPYIVRRINLAKAYLTGKNLDELLKMPLPGISPVLEGMEDLPIEELHKRFDLLYVYYLAWNKNRDLVAKDTANLETWLRHLFTKTDISLNWIVYWIDAYSPIEPVLLKKFWGTTSKDGDPLVPPSFTIDGNKLRVQFIKELFTAISDPLLIAQKEKSFEEWYFHQYQRAWLTFFKGFSKGVDGLETRSEWQQMAMRMTQNKNPYFDLLHEAANQLKPVLKSTSHNRWVDVTLNIASVMELSKKNEELSQSKNAISKVTKKGKKLLNVINTKLNKLSLFESEEEIKAQKLFKQYRQQLEGLTSVITSRNNAYKVAKQIFVGGSAGSEKNPLVSALNIILQMKTLFGNNGINAEYVWQIFQGPVDFIWSYTCLEAACYLQEQWEEQVLSEAQGPADWGNLKRMLFGENGKVWRFIKGPALPFIGWRSGRGYYVKEAMGAQLPFYPEFIQFLNKTASGKTTLRNRYDVFIRAFPTDVNSDAITKPYETTLEMQCGDGSYILRNLNYPVSKSFKWQPGICGDVVLTIKVGNLKLVKQYSGDHGFPEFLADFRDGERVFYPYDFPEHEDAIKRLGIRFIRVRYQFKGNRPLLRLLQHTPNNLPEKIVNCWEF